MPELAEVEWFRKQWNAGIGHEIVGLKAHSRKYVFRGTDGDALRQNLIGQKLVRSKRSGKQMLFEFSGDNSEMIGARENVRSWLGIHLGMTGKTHIKPSNFQSGKHDHLVLYQRDRSLVFTDPRQLGHVRFHHGKEEPDWWNGRPPEIDSREFDREFFNDFVDRHRNAPIKAALLMQHGFPGVGNWMADEILWRAKVLPSKRIRKLTAHERSVIFRATKWVVRRSLETLGKDFSDPPKNWLIHQKWKRGGICPIHRTPLRRASVAGRTTAWCPKCQK
ncbi:MAG TPA: DNA-formamidopyrimidine glycosylase family protein [Chthoniobacterales bacterium]|jgi:formamidopyrimidine-DNA glycosylase|nr:DNA-formamidopyrimidine glycosylase family protein [Chthoniobacterales bacterium]